MTLDGVTKTVEVTEGQSLLDAAEEVCAYAGRRSLTSLTHVLATPPEPATHPCMGRRPFRPSPYQRVPDQS
jgi:hypothetical protein